MTFANFKVGRRLGAGFGVLILLLTSITLLAIVRMDGLYQDTDLIANNRYPKVANAFKIQQELTQSAVLLRDLLIQNDPQQIKQTLSDINAIRQDMSSRFDEMGQQMPTPKGRRIFAEMVQARSAYRTGESEFMKLVEEDRKPEAIELLNTVVIRDQKIYSDKVKGIIDLGEKFMHDGSEQAAQEYGSSTRIMLGLAGLAILLAAALGYWVTRSMTRPLQTAVRVACTAASGDLTSPIKEIGIEQLNQAIAEMDHVLQQNAALVEQAAAAADASQRQANGPPQTVSVFRLEAPALEIVPMTAEQLALADNADQRTALSGPTSSTPSATARLAASERADGPSLRRVA